MHVSYPRPPCTPKHSLHSLLSSWLLRQKQEGDAAVKREVSEAREILEESRQRWVKSVVASISEISDLDASFFRSSLSCGSKVATGSGTSTLFTDTANLHGHLLLPQTPEGNVGKPACAESDPKERGADTFGWESLCAGVPTLNGGDASRPEQSCDALSVAREEHGSGGGCGNSLATLQPHDTTEGYQNMNNNNHNNNRGAATTAFEIETLAAQKRCARLESVADLARQGMSAHWKAFFRDEIERTRMAAAGVDMTAERWVQRQREAAGVMWASWRDREWKSASARDTGKDGGEAASTGEGEPAVADGVPSATGTEAKEATTPATVVTTTTTSPGTQASDHEGDSSKKEEEEAAPEMAGGVVGVMAENKAPPPVDIGGTGAVETGERHATSLEGTTQVDDNQANNEPGSTAAEDNEGGGGFQLSEGYVDGDSSCVVVVRDVGDHISAGQEVPLADADAEEAAGANQLVVFVGRTMAFHISTVRPSYLENFNEENRRRRCSSFSLPQLQEQQGKRYATCNHCAHSKMKLVYSPSA